MRLKTAWVSAVSTKKGQRNRGRGGQGLDPFLRRFSLRETRFSGAWGVLVGSVDINGVARKLPERNKVSEQLGELGSDPREPFNPGKRLAQGERSASNERTGA